MEATEVGAKLVLFTLAVLAGGAPTLAETPDYRPSKSEAVLLPRFCWAQMVGDVRGPEFEIPRKTCGVAMNHYCIGLIDLSRANKTFGNKNRKRSLLITAKNNILYTLRGMTGYPKCPIRGHAEKTLEQVEGKLRAIK